MVGSILVDYQPKRRCMTLEQPRFHDFCPDSGILSVPWHRALGTGGCREAADIP